MNLEVLNEINNQCSVVQKTIAQNFGLPEDELIVKELLILLNLLEKYLKGQNLPLPRHNFTKLI